MKPTTKEISYKGNIYHLVAWGRNVYYTPNSGILKCVSCKGNVKKSGIFYINGKSILLSCTKHNCIDFAMTSKKLEEAIYDMLTVKFFDSV